jgi:hypothetical protein
MTANMLQAVAEGRFHDRLWVDTLLHHFSDYYFEALVAYEQATGQVPAIWQLTHDASRREGLSPLQHLLLGVNAHINFDLALALRDVLAPEWEDLSEDAKRQRYEDHVMVNQIIAETIDAVQDEVLERYQPLMDVVDKMLGPVDEWATARLISHWRDEVWESALILIEAQDEQAQALTRDRLEERALRRAKVFLLA